MKTKKLLVSGIIGGIASFLLGWLLYGMLFKDYFPGPSEESTESLVLIFLGSLTFGLLISYIFVHWAQISTAATGAKAGAILGLLLGLYFNFFNMAMNTEATFQLFALDVGLSIILTAIVGAIVGIVNSKME
ncbi:DUF1761 family protein [Snuella sedimenti]|uniref:DUF1761 family protein n=1 Tax=Snuella sedimenti TaxID=2798802 RepID=A0A8J7LTT5_9FLAO|nr:DUF1761 family protein [Snuella sedimenti]MBJ6368721.1 DUF1761 family protein [Snuella sedimenti]